MDIVDAIIPAPNNDIDTLHPSLVFRQQCFQRIQIIAVDNHVFAVILSFGSKGIFLFQRAERHVQMVIDHLIFSDPVKCRHIISPSIWSVYEEVNKNPSYLNLLYYTDNLPSRKAKVGE